MLTITPVHPEGPRYTAPILYLPGVWVGPEVWRLAAGFLGHRGWRGEIVNARGVDGGIAARSRAIAEHVGSLDAPPVLVAIDAGAGLALAVARTVAVRALVLVSPLIPGAPGTHAFVWSWRLVWSLVRRGVVDAPRTPLVDALHAELPVEIRRGLGPEPARLVADLARGSTQAHGPASCPTLIVRGTADPLCSATDADALGERLGAAVEVVPGTGHWLVVGPAWRTCVQVIHRWLVRTLGEPLLELYAEAMADRDDADGD